MTDVAFSVIATVIRLFLVAVFAAAAAHNLESERVPAATYLLWPYQWRRTLRHGMTLWECVLAAGLLLDSRGLLAASATFALYGAATGAAWYTGYRGACGCGRDGRLSRVLIGRDYLWSVVSLAVFAAVARLSPQSAAAIAAGVVGITMLSVLLTVALGKRYVTSSWSAHADVHAVS